MSDKTQLKASISPSVLFVLPPGHETNMKSDHLEETTGRRPTLSHCRGDTPVTTP